MSITFDEKVTAIAELVEMADDESLFGEWTAETANDRCEKYARLVHGLFPERCPVHGVMLHGVFQAHHCN